VALITFKGWEGKWWKKIKVGRAALSAAGWVVPLKWQLVWYGGRWVYKAVRARRR